MFLPKDTAGKRTHHLHVFGVASPHPRENRIFRDYLRARPETARRYEASKRRAADLHPDSRARYGDAKEAVVLEVMAEARLWAVSRRPGP
ncbi:GrpB family protein [Streptomyces sp. PSKA28]|uniref:GrpB family protein n=1 Tax=Streptomyces himalayensis subsp. himalayensis TaxID=2756131 RepID=A0A7W0DNS2_9ACTN|nr:GrpB family protein [Streptomyces himalayensis subsp. himalayensis]